MRKDHDEQLAEGRAALSAAGVGESETDPGVLLPLAGGSEALDRALVERLGRAPGEDRAAALRELAVGAAQRGWKTAAKDAKRALYRFTQLGIAVPAAPEPAPLAPRFAAPTLEAYVSSIDGRGDRLVWLVRPQREGGLLVLTAIVNEPEGLRDVALAELGRKTLRRMEQDLRAQHGLRMIPIDAAYCDALLAEAYERARAAEVPGIGDYPTCRARMIADAPVPRGEALIERLLSSAELTSPAAIEHATALLGEHEFASWLLEEPVLRPYLDAILAVRDSPLLLSRPQQEDRVEDVVGRALRELFAGSISAAWRRRLEEMAYYLHATDRRQLAVAAAATAHALGTSSVGGQGIPFFEQLTRTSIAALAGAESQRAKEEERDSLIVKPSAATAPPRVRPR